MPPSPRRWSTLALALAGLAMVAAGHHHHHHGHTVPRGKAAPAGSPGGTVHGTLQLPADIKPAEGPGDPILVPNGFLAIQPPVLDPRPDMVVYLEPAAKTPNAAPAAEATTVTLTGSRLSPRTVAVVVGSRVDFVIARDGGIGTHHRLYAPDIPAFAQQDQKPGEKRSQVFEVAGHYSILDAAVPHIQAEVLAVAHPYFANPDAHGNFAIAGVPDGAYTLQVFYGGATPLYSAPLAVQNGGAEVTVKLPADLSGAPTPKGS